MTLPYLVVAWLGGIYLQPVLHPPDQLLWLAVGQPLSAASTACYPPSWYNAATLNTSAVKRTALWPRWTQGGVASRFEAARTTTERSC
jgi:hypothetical protein